MPLLSGLAIPRHSLHLVLRHAVAVGVAIPQDELGVGMPLLSGLAIPRHSLHEVPRHAFAEVVAIPQFDLGIGVPLLRGLAIPRHRLHLVLRHAFAVGVANPQVELGNRVTPFGPGLVALKSVLRRFRASSQQAKDDSYDPAAGGEVHNT